MHRKVDEGLRVVPLIVALVLPGCDAGTGSAPDRVAGVPTSIDLSARLRSADLYREGEIQNLCGPDADSLLTAGWHAYTPGEEGPGRRWTRGRRALVEVPIVAPGDATLRLTLAPVPSAEACPGCGPRAPKDLLRRVEPAKPQQVRVLWNDEPLGEIALGLTGEATTTELAIPGSQQRIGLNRLELLLSFWLAAGSHAITGDPRTLGVGCEGLELRSGSPLQQRAGPAAVVRNGSLIQLDGSVVTYHLALPDDARLVGRARLPRRPGSAADANGLGVELAVARADGVQRRLPLVREPGSDSLRVDESLSEDGEMVGLSLAFRGESGVAALEWQELRVEGVVAPEADSAVLPREPYNVFIVVLDSLRADHVEPNGAVGVATPRIAGLAAEGVTFLGARSSASWTRPAIATLFTSLSPSAHGVHDMNARLSRKAATLPAILRKQGYRTVGVTNNVMVSRGFGFARGFDKLHHHYSTVDESWLSEYASPESRAAFVWDRYVSPALVRDPGRPFFVYLHEIDPHSPYDWTEAYEELYDFGYRGNLTFDLATTRRIRNDPTWADPLDIRYFNARYRGEVTAMDRYVGWLLDRLEQEGLAERTLFVLASDHGEEFMEHRSVGHGHALYEELLRIPLIARLPAALPAGLRVDVGAQLIDLAPTILDLIGAAVPDPMEGVSLLPYLDGEPGGLDAGRALRRRPAFAVSQGPRHASVRVGDWKLIVERDADDGAPDGHLLFDLRSDPGESLDRWAREPVVGHTLRAVLDAKQSEAAVAGRPAPGESGELAPDVIEGLRALGYID